MTAEIEVTCPACNAVLLAPDEEAGYMARCPCGEYVQVPCRTFVQKLRNWSNEVAYRKWRYDQMKNNGLNNVRRDNTMFVGFIVILIGLWVALNTLMRWGNEPLGPRMGYDMTASTPVMVDHPDGSVTVEKIPVFTSTKGYTDREARTTVWAAFLIYGGPLCLMVLCLLPSVLRQLRSMLGVIFGGRA